MKQWLPIGFGALLVVVPIGLVVGTGTVPTADPLLVASVVVVPLAGVLSMLGGLGVGVGRVEWFQFIGLSNVLFGGWVLWFALSTLLSTPSDVGTIVSVSLVGLGSVALTLIGVDWARGPKYFDVEAYENAPLFQQAN